MMILSYKTTDWEGSGLPSGDLMLSVTAGTAALWGVARYVAGQFAREDGVPLPARYSGAWIVPTALLAFWLSVQGMPGEIGVRVLLTAYLALAALVDKWSGYIPDTAHLAAVLLVTVFRLAGDTFTAGRLLAGAEMVLIVGLFPLLLFKGEGVGGGDIKLAGVLAFALGLGPAAAIYWAGNLIALTQALVRKWSRRPAWSDVRMGPYFLVGYTALLWIPVSWIPAPLHWLGLP